MNERNVDRIFVSVLAYKGITGLLETIGGILLMFLSKNTISHIIVRLTQDELLENPHDFLANHLIQWSATIQTSAVLIIAIYLIVQGIIKLLLAYGLWKNHIIVYPIAAGLAIAFILYQLYRFAHTHSLWLFVLSGIDIIYVALILHEFEKKRAHKHTQRMKSQKKPQTRRR